MKRTVVVDSEIHWSDEVNHWAPYATPDELAWLRRCAKNHLTAGDQVVMIGAGPGVMALAVLETQPDVVMTVADIVGCDFLKQYARRLEPTDLTALKMSSHDLSLAWLGAPIALLIIDGDHSEAGVTRDLADWAPRVDADGLIFVHDYDAHGTMFQSQEQYPGSKLAVTNFVRENSHWMIVEQVGTAAVLGRVVPHG